MTIDKRSYTEDIVKMASNYNDVTVISWENYHAGSKDRLIASLISDNVFINKKRYGKHIIDIGNSTDGNTLVSDVLLSYLSLISVIYWLRLNGNNINNVASVEIVEGRADIGAVLLGADSENAMLIVKECHRQLIEQSIQYNKIMMSGRYLTVKFRVEDVDNLEIKMINLFSKVFSIIDSFRIRYGKSDISIYESANTTCLIDGNEIMLLSANRDSKDSRDNFSKLLADCKYDMNLGDFKVVHML